MLILDSFEYATDAAVRAAWSNIIQTISNTLGAKTTTTSDTNHRQVIPTGNITSSGDMVTIRFKGHVTNDFVINSCSIGERSGETSTFATDPTRITFGGSNGGTIPAGSYLTSDTIDFTIDETKSYMIHIYGNASHATAGVIYGGCLGGRYFKDSTATDYSMTKDITGITPSRDGYQILLSDIYIRNTKGYSESTIKQTGSYSMKLVAAQTISLNAPVTRTLSPTWNLTGQTSIKFWVRASRTGSNFKIGFHDSGGATTEVTPNIASADTWQEVTLDISAVTDANKDALDSIILTITNADAENTIYLDYMRALSLDEGVTTGYDERYSSYNRNSFLPMRGRSRDLPTGLIIQNS